jgi:hypothetical protein
MFYTTGGGGFFQAPLFFQFSPIPTINISTEINYANDVIIGYNYIITLDGFATNYRSHIDQEKDANLNTIRKPLANIATIQRVLSQNSGRLELIGPNNEPLITANGGQLRSLTFNETPNNWTKYITYQAELVFNELNILGETFSCSSSFIDSGSITPDLVDIEKFKIKDFTDSWSFSIENDNINYVLDSDEDQPLPIDNSIINVQYSLSATGKNYYATGTPPTELSPAWIQAKNFVQKRLFDQVSNLDNILKLSGNACEPTDSLSSIHSPGDGLIKNVSQVYKTFNETLSSSCSESNGTFELTYACILKNNKSSNFSSPDTRHTINKDISSSTEGDKNNVTISVNGTIEGLFAGGLIKAPGNFNIPDNGHFIVGNTLANKFNSANNLLPSILNADEDDLSVNLKQALGITIENLGLDGGSFSECGGAPSVENIKPSSFSLTKNYMEGTITYSAEYTSERACSEDTNGKTITKSSLNVTGSVPIIVEFPIPGGNYLIQDLKTVTARNISLNIEGRTDRLCCLTETNIGAQIGAFCGTTMEGFFPFIDFPDTEQYLEIQKTFDYTPTDGSYNININYICASGCPI